MATSRRRGAAALTLLALALGVAACGKTQSQHTASGGPTHAVAPVAAPGAVSVATRNTTRLGGGDVTADAAAVARTVYPGLTGETRPHAVLLVDRHNCRRRSPHPHSRPPRWAPRSSTAKGSPCPK